MSADAWVVNAAEHRFGDHLGRPALFIDGGVATAIGIEARDGVVEVDVALERKRGFHGLIWRAENPGDYESFFVRPHQSGNPDATQYTPVFNGVSGWQLYHGDRYTAPLAYRFDGWTRLRVAFAGPVAEVFVGGGEEPVLRVDLQKRETAAGGVGLLDGGLGGVWYSNVRVSCEPPQLVGGARPDEAAVPGVLPYWDVSDPIAEARLDGSHELPGALLADRTWTRLRSEPCGLVNLARAHGIADGADTVFARAVIHADGPRTARLGLGFSDRARAFLNRWLLFEGDDGYRTRDYRFLGSIGWWDTVLLQLDPGENELVVAVSETFGGWGVQARIDEADGLRIGT